MTAAAGPLAELIVPLTEALAAIANDRRVQAAAGPAATPGTIVSPLAAVRACAAEIDALVAPVVEGRTTPVVAGAVLELVARQAVHLVRLCGIAAPHDTALGDAGTRLARVAERMTAAREKSRGVRARFRVAATPDDPAWAEREAWARYWRAKADVDTAVRVLAGHALVAGGALRYRAVAAAVSDLAARQRPTAVPNDPLGPAWQALLASLVGARTVARLCLWTVPSPLVTPGAVLAVAAERAVRGAAAAGPGATDPAARWWPAAEAARASAAAAVPSGQPGDPEAAARWWPTPDPDRLPPGADPLGLWAGADDPRWAHLPALARGYRAHQQLTELLAVVTGHARVAAGGRRAREIAATAGAIAAGLAALERPPLATDPDSFWRALAGVLELAGPLEAAADRSRFLGLGYPVQNWRHAGEQLDDDPFAGPPLAAARDARAARGGAGSAGAPARDSAIAAAAAAETPTVGATATEAARWADVAAFDGIVGRIDDHLALHYRKADALAAPLAPRVQPVAERLAAVEAGLAPLLAWPEDDLAGGWRALGGLVPHVRALDRLAAISKAPGIATAGRDGAAILTAAGALVAAGDAGSAAGGGAGGGEAATDQPEEAAGGPAGDGSGPAASVAASPRPAPSSASLGGDEETTRSRTAAVEWGEVLARVETAARKSGGGAGLLALADECRALLAAAPRGDADARAVWSALAPVADRGAELRRRCRLLAAAGHQSGWIAGGGAVGRLVLSAAAKTVGRLTRTTLAAERRVERAAGARRGPRPAFDRPAWAEERERLAAAAVAAELAEVARAIDADTRHGQRFADPTYQPLRERAEALADAAEAAGAAVAALPPGGDPWAGLRALLPAAAAVAAAADGASGSRYLLSALARETRAAAARVTDRGWIDRATAD